MMVIEPCLKTIFCRKLIKRAADNAKLSSTSNPPDNRMAKYCASMNDAALFLHRQITADMRRMLKII